MSFTLYFLVGLICLFCGHASAFVVVKSFAGLPRYGTTLSTKRERVSSCHERFWRHRMILHATTATTVTNNSSDRIGAPTKSSPSFASYQTIEIEEYEGYTRCLSPREELWDVRSEFLENTRPVWQRVLRRLFRKRRTTRPGSLILLRCGQSELNQNSTFTGWLDPPLTQRGIDQCRHAAQLLVTEGMDDLDVVYTSRLQRSILSAWAVLEVLQSLYIPIQKTYRLNQRHYGALQGLCKHELTQMFGPQVVQAWRNSLKARPPPLARDDPSHPLHDRRYQDLQTDKLPDTESLWECQERARTLWEHKIRRDIQKGRTVLVVAHRDSLRGLSKVIDGISDEDVDRIAIPAAVPIVYHFEYAADAEQKTVHLQPLDPSPGSLTQLHTRGRFLEKPGRLEQALEYNRRYEQALAPATSNGEQQQQKLRRLQSLEKSLIKLRREVVEDDEKDRVAFREGTDKEFVELRLDLPSEIIEKESGEHWSDDDCEFEEYDEFSDFSKDDDGNGNGNGKEVNGDDVEDFELPVLTLDDSTSRTKKQLHPMQGPYVVLIRHGRTPHNNMQLFTGWEDPPLAEEGIEDAKNAGRLLKLHGFEFDVVYTSWLTRAIQTAFYTLVELDSVWLPIVKSWRLNERMYGALTGKSKKMIAMEYGEEQLKKWRRGYKIRPPPTSSYSFNYPGNDERRAKHFKDLRISFRETLNRSIEKRRLSIHRKFPKTESLKDCMDRSIPFYTQRIQRDAIDKGKRVLITSHENAIRGILMHLCDIPEDAMNQLHLPNGLPLVYNVRNRCLTLLDDGGGTDPMDAHDFGPAAKYLFQQCELLDPDENVD